MSKWIRKGDHVVVITGNDKGKVGTVLARHEEKVLVQGINLRRKHVKRSQEMQQGIVDIERPIHVSNVALSDKEGNRIKVSIHIGAKGEKELVHKGKGKDGTYRVVRKHV